MGRANILRQAQDKRVLLWDSNPLTQTPLVLSLSKHNSATWPQA